MCDSVTIMKNGETLGTYPMQEKTESELLSTDGRNRRLETGTTTAKTVRQKVEKDIFIKAPHIKNSVLWNRGKSGDWKRREIIGVAGLQGHGQTDLVDCLVWCTWEK